MNEDTPETAEMRRQVRRAVERFMRIVGCLGSPEPTDREAWNAWNEVTGIGLFRWVDTAPILIDPHREGCPCSHCVVTDAETHAHAGGREVERAAIVRWLKDGTTYETLCIKAHRRRREPVHCRDSERGSACLRDAIERDDHSPPRGDVPLGASCYSTTTTQPGRTSNG